MLSGVVLEGGGVIASKLEEFTVCNSLIHDCSIAIYVHDVEYLFVGDRDAVSQTLIANRCSQCIQAESVGSVMVSNVMVQDVGGVFLVGPCSIFEVSNVSVLDCGRFGVVNAASPVILSSCSISCVYPALETRGHGARYSLVSMRPESTYPIQNIPVMGMPLINTKKLSFQPDPLVKRQRIEVEKSDLDAIKKHCATPPLLFAPLSHSTVCPQNSFKPDDPVLIGSESITPSFAHLGGDVGV